ncbi:MAG: DUF4136 domain-containing protein [Melioribacteraceae bacterium]|nr:DUF4136 domain-containing protein [Melioribacteraceae bacterium]RJP63274.1 MAG: DUF4136 domain-containing protein [Ignavibacteriales bacterium]WKZ69550.1 MAG: DUF4136 domain-containing protein [Melioribacteraceae bacterium]
MSRSILFLFIILLFTSCSTITVNSDYDSAFNFTEYTSYKIIKTLPQRPNGVAMPSLTFNLVREAIESELTKSGVGKNEHRADFGITWHTALNDNVYENVESLKDWNDYFDSAEEGMLIIDFVDINTNQIVWRGWSKNVLTSENLEEKIKESVRKILSLYPPKEMMGIRN